jgi:pimeloyl-ACP methyl ester carboxylesterase
MMNCDCLCQIRDNLVNPTPRTSKRVRLRHFLERNQRHVAAAAIVCFIGGVILSQHLEPGTRIEKVILAGDTPALKFIPVGAGPHPIVLLAHGYSATKETLFWYGEAFSGAGFVCYSVDLPGHGESPQPYSFVDAAHTIGRVGRSLGSVDVFVGHSMGGIAGGEAVREELFHPKLVIAVGADTRLGEHAPPLLFLIGRFDEFFKPDELKTRTDAQTIVSPWSNHGFELFDPLLIHAAVNAASTAVDQPTPSASSTWCWQVAGVFLALLGALGMALALPEFPPRWMWLRGLLIALFIGSAYFLTLNMCLDLKPHPQNFLSQTITTLVAIILLAGAGKLRIPRWTFAVLALALAILAVVATNTLMAHITIPLFQIVRLSLVLAPALFVGTMVGILAAFRGSRFSGDVAMAVTIGCGLFQLGNAPRTIPNAPAPQHFIPLDAKVHEACAGRYEFAPDNVFRTGAEVKIWREGEQMLLQATGRRVLQGAHEMLPESETNFFLPANGAELTFVKNDNGEVTGLIHHMTGLPDSEAKKINH